VVWVISESLEGSCSAQSLHIEGSLRPYPISQSGVIHREVLLLAIELPQRAHFRGGAHHSIEAHNPLSLATAHTERTAQRAKTCTDDSR